MHIGANNKINTYEQSDDTFVDENFSRTVGFFTTILKYEMLY